MSSLEPTGRSFTKLVGQRVAIASCALVMLVVSSEAHAAKPKPGSGADASRPGPDAVDDATRTRARNHFKAGEALHNLGRYDEAITEFLAAHALVPFPELLLNVAQSYRLAGKPTMALEFYGRFLDAAPDTERRASVEKFMAEEKAKIEAGIRDEPDVAPGVADLPEAPTVSAAAVSPDSGHKTKKPGSKRWLVWSAVGVIAVGAVVGVSVGMVYATRLPRGDLDTLDFRSGTPTN